MNYMSFDIVFQLFCTKTHIILPIFSAINLILIFIIYEFVNYSVLMLLILSTYFSISTTTVVITMTTVVIDIAKQLQY